MKIIKNTFLVLATAEIMTSCKTSITTIPVPAGSSQAVVATGKKVPLSEEEEKGWNHADLVTDSIPGMSTKKAYEFLSGKKQSK